MIVRTDLPIKMKEYAKDNDKRLELFKAEIENNAKAARDYAYRVLLAKTPHAGDNKPRGANMIGTGTDTLNSSWHMDYEIAEQTEGRDGPMATITITNEKPYAPFVEYGHRLTKHFVPWLYIDSQGLLAREVDHNQPLFGLTVGGKTSFVKGAGMVEKAMKAFDRKFDKLNKLSMKKIFVQDQFKIIFNCGE